jgi:hypothetical protein
MPVESPPFQIHVTEERCECLKCERVIPRHRVVKNLINSRIIAPTQQRVRAHCEHCDTLFEVIRELQNGCWTIPTGNNAVTIVTDPNVIASFLRRIAHLTGDKQIA